MRAQGRGVLKMKGREAQREEKRPRARRKEEEAVRKVLKEGPWPSSKIKQKIPRGKPLKTQKETKMQNARSRVRIQKKCLDLD